MPCKEEEDQRSILRQPVGRVIVSTQHISRHGLAKAATTGDASILTLGVKALIDHSNKTGLIYIYTIYGLTEPVVTFIDIYS